MAHAIIRESRHGRRRKSRRASRLQCLRRLRVIRVWRMRTPCPQLLRAGRLVDPLNGRIQHGIELGIGLLGRQPLDQRPREARHDAVIPAQAVVGFCLHIAARQRDHPHDIGMTDAIDIEIILLREGELEHDQLTCGQFVELVEDGRLSNSSAWAFSGQ